jgi:hypothetical protein
MIKYNHVICCITLWLYIGSTAMAQKQVKLRSDKLEIDWVNKANGYNIASIRVKGKTGFMSLEQPSGIYDILYSKTKPDSSVSTSFPEGVLNFPDPIYKYTKRQWLNNLKPVAMNQVGEAISFFPKSAIQSDNDITFFHETSQAKVEAKWSISSKYENDIIVSMVLTAKEAGYFSLPSPDLAFISESELSWGMIPGHFQGRSINPNLVLSYGYGQGIPNEPVIVRERTASALCPLISTKRGLTIAVIPEPGYGRDPWVNNKYDYQDWYLGLSLMNRQKKLTPKLYHPVLGEKKSWLNKGETVSFKFRYTIQQADWNVVYQHVVNDIYQFPEFLKLKKTNQSLTNRIFSMRKYLKDSITSLWRTESFNGLEIGAQAYLGGVVGSDKDAMKNSDYGAMWMLTRLTGDKELERTRLSYARDFKLAQQEQQDPFFKGAAAGQYYLSKSKRFTEEWGNYVEPVASTYYIMLDIGNMLLFNPNDEVLKGRLKLGAEKLMNWQLNDGSWEVAYDHKTKKSIFNDLKDYRPTFYGLLVAYRILGDIKYLESAKKGADWYIENAVNNGFFLGVCGDARFAPDFATGQGAQGLLDLHDLTNEKKYLDAAINTAKIYTTSVYTHPIPTNKRKLVNGRYREDWEISQVGLSFEHGGNLGSAIEFGPILLASHNGMFVRMFSLTGDSLFLNMARAAAWGRDAFVDPKTNVASYYWTAMDEGPGPFPHHAWWQIGWITDYLMSEIQLRSRQKVIFKRGFITPKVGPHQPYGFSSGCKRV